MHPLLASASRLALYLCSWSLAALVLAVGYAQTSPLGRIEALVILAPPWLIYSFVCLSAWYVCRASPLEAGNAPRIIAAHLVSGMLASGVWILTWEVWSRILAGLPAYGQGILEMYRSQSVLIFAAGVLLFWLSGIFHYLLMAFERSRQADAREMGLEVMAREAELKALRAQIDPHFLFNSLQSISALTTTDPPGARRMCLLLAEFFRSGVRLGAEERIRIEEEMEMVRQYLEIEKVRFGTRLSSDITLAASCQTCMIPPLILQPLVENAVRHGIHSLVEGGMVRVAARCDAHFLHLSVENPVDAEAPAISGTGIGLANVRRRLETGFDGRAVTRVRRQGGVFQVEIRIPCINGNERPGS